MLPLSWFGVYAYVVEWMHCILFSYAVQFAIDEFQSGPIVRYLHLPAERFARVVVAD